MAFFLSAARENNDFDFRFENDMNEKGHSNKYIDEKEYLEDI